MANCPICKTEAGQLDRIGDAIGFDCPRHGKFKVASSVLAQASTKDASSEQWERALQKATAKDPGAWAPCILTYDF
jgi:hypothetical protein